MYVEPDNYFSDEVLRKYKLGKYVDPKRKAEIHKNSKREETSKNKQESAVEDKKTICK